MAVGSGRDTCLRLLRRCSCSDPPWAHSIPGSSVFSTAKLVPFAGTDSSCFVCCCASALRSKRSFTGCPRFCAAEIAFRGLHRCMAQQELNLLQFTTAVVAQLRTGSAQVVRGNAL